eukprot:1140332-Pelagomonas_calceolata.AAC.9
MAALLQGSNILPSLQQRSRSDRTSIQHLCVKTRDTHVLRHEVCSACSYFVHESCYSTQQSTTTTIIITTTILAPLSSSIHQFIRPSIDHHNHLSAAGFHKAYCNPLGHMICVVCLCANCCYQTSPFVNTTASICRLQAATEHSVINHHLTLSAFMRMLNDLDVLPNMMSKAQPNVSAANNECLWVRETCGSLSPCITSSKIDVGSPARDGLGGGIHCIGNPQSAYMCFCTARYGPRQCLAAEGINSGCFSVHFEEFVEAIGRCALTAFNYQLKHATAISSVIRVCPSSFKADIRVHVCMSVKKGCDGGQAGLSDGNCANRMIDDM